MGKAIPQTGRGLLRQSASAVVALCLMLAYARSGYGQQAQQGSNGQSSQAAALPVAPTPSPTDTGSGVSNSSSLQGGTGGGEPVQLPTQSSLFNAYLGSIQVGPAVPQVLSITFDDALHMGIENNLGLVYANQSVVQQQAQRLQVLNVLLPNIDVQGSTGLHQFNLESEGFRPDILPEFASLLGGGGGATTSFPLIIKVDVTQGQANFSQYLFDWAGLDLVRALGHLIRSTSQSESSSRGLVVQNVGIAYLRVIAARSQVDYDRTLLATDSAVLYQTQQEHQAGIAANLDELRSRVQYQTQQQAVTADENTLAKAKIALNRSIGLAPEQEIRVTDAAPFAELETMTPEEAETHALAARQDYQSAIEQVHATEMERKAAGHERYPTLIFNANYGVTGISGGAYHDTFAAVGTLDIPVFQEAKFRSDRDLTEYMLDNARAQVANIRGQIAQQVRDGLIDLNAANDTLAIAKSNAALSQVALQQSVERFRAGVEDNLPSIEAASTLAQAQVQFVNAQFQYNQAKLNLARDLGLIDVDFYPEWHGGRPAGVLSDRAAMGH
jgi:outer membrane protein TolC